MNTAVLVTLIGVIVAAGLVAWMFWNRRRTERLRGRFGAEYYHTVRELGDRRRAEAELARREERVHKFPIRALDEGQRARFSDAWRSCQAHFVDDPGGAVSEADRLCIEVMRVRGYPMSDFEQRAEDLSVEHPRVVEHYRAAHGLTLKHERGQSTTEDLRKAMVHYRTLFEGLLGTMPGERLEVHR